MKNKWLEDAVFYEIYPTSFRDSNKDGIGDMNGIAEKIDDIAKSGFNGIWINACFSSEFRDGGYDVTDYYHIDKRFGTDEDFEKLAKKASEKGIKILLDLVIGHTSDQHPWFIESCKKERNRYSDYYIWTNDVFENGTDCTTVNGISERDGGYGINFFQFQPALNFGFYNVTRPWQMHYTSDATKPLRDEIVNIIMYWVNKGVSGFRVDIANSLVKGDINGEGCAYVWNYIIGKVHEQNPDVIFLSEWSNPAEAVGKAGFDMDFILHSTDEYNSLFRYENETNIGRKYEKGDSFFRQTGKGKIDPFCKFFFEQQKVISEKGYIAIPSGNHDLRRIAFGRSQRDLKVVFAFLMTFPCVPFVYYGDEIGMPFMDGLQTKDGGYNRTGSRVPMLWNSGKNRGFSETDGEVYLPIFEGEEDFEMQEQDSDSLLNCVRKLISVRHTYPQLRANREVVIDNAEYPFCYSREDIHVCLNPSSKSYEVKADVREVLASLGAKQENGKIVLDAASFIIYK